MEKHKLDIVGIQETNCSGNTLSTLAAGFLLNNSDNPFPGKEEHRGTGLIFRKTLAQALRKTYQGSSRWCGALFLANPVPLLILSVYAPTATAETDTKDTFYQDISEIIAENGGAMIVRYSGRFQCPHSYGPRSTKTRRTKHFQRRAPIGNVLRRGSGRAFLISSYNKTW